SEDVNVYVHKSFGLIADNISDSILNGLRGHFGIGHVRYSTAGGALAENIQPFQFKTSLGPVAIAHNGNLTNANQIRMQLEASGSVFQSTSDTEVLVHLIARSSCSSIRERIGDALRQVKGAYSLTIMTSEAMYAARDPGGVRPLALGTLDHGFIVASETCAFDLVGAQFIRDIDAGEVVEMTSRGVNSWYPQERRQLTFCSFEPIYFARPDSLLHGESIYLRRKRIGVLLAKECPIDGDVVIPIPDSGMAMAEGFSQESKIPMAMGLVRNHYIGRTFIQPSQMQRDMGVRLKLNTVKSVLKDKRVVVVDDSLVRGTTAARILKLIKDAGAREIHFRIGAPPITHSCFYGVDTPKRQDLLAAQKNVEEIRDIVGADSIGFISLEGLRKALEETHERAYCMACFTGIYPEDVGLIIPSQPTDICGTGLYSKK
ncbi:MAG: amidophosphoribosyltransferase, partial [Proteobacteria bacterium]|nr:amidophosphoribosyltransferase [Pseudomonadota bacterium]